MCYILLFCIIIISEKLLFCTKRKIAYGKRRIFKMTIDMRYDSFNYERQCVIQTMSDVFYSAIIQRSFDIFDFTNKLLSTDLFDRYPYDLSLFLQ